MLGSLPVLEIRHRLNSEFQPMHHTSGMRRTLYAAVASTLAISMGALGLASAEAATITPDSVNPAPHIYDCLGALFSDAVAHQQYCGAGSRGTAPPSTLAPTFSSPPVACQPVGSLPYPLFVTFKTAALDDSVIGSDFARHLGGTHLATLLRCPPPCTASLGRPAFPKFDVASVDQTLSPTGFGQHLAGLHVAFCCFSSLSRPLFSTFGVATLDDQMVNPASVLGRNPLAAVC